MRSLANPTLLGCYHPRPIATCAVPASIPTLSLKKKTANQKHKELPPQLPFSLCVCVVLCWHPWFCCSFFQVGDLVLEKWLCFFCRVTDFYYKSALWNNANVLFFIVCGVSINSFQTEVQRKLSGGLILKLLKTSLYMTCFTITMDFVQIAKWCVLVSFLYIPRVQWKLRGAYMEACRII